MRGPRGHDRRTDDARADYIFLRETARLANLQIDAKLSLLLPPLPPPPAGKGGGHVYGFVQNGLKSLLL